MDWQCPQALYLVLPLCVGWFALAFYSQKRREKARARFVDASMGDRMLPPMSQSRFWGKLVLQETAIVMGLLALAQPQFGEQVEQVVPRGSDLYVMIDVSRSMLATDVPPSRLERAKADVLSLVNQLDGERIGLIAFAGQAVVKCPLTVDYDSFRRSLIELDPNSAPRGGTAIGDAIRKSLEVFQANSQRDQAILLITDGDDQQSYPLEAAAAAAERKVAIFSVGLGDATTGARIPQRSSQGKEIAGTFVEHEGQQVWSKLDGSLLQEIALKTSGVYVPAGTKTYDLGELYNQHLQGRRGDESESQTRVRKSERFQVFLLMSLLALLADLSLSRYRVAVNAPVVRKVALACCLSLVACMARPATANDEANKSKEANKNNETNKSTDANTVDPQRKVAEGLKHFADQQFAEAQSAFALASEKLQAEKSNQASIAAFDEACALHRKGDFDAAKERYLQAGLSQDRALSTSSHFNLAMMASEQARVLAGDNPETVPTEKRTEILDKLKQSIGSYRHCLEIDPKHAPSRKNLELVRQWIKFYSDRWAELDRQKRRNETNLMQFLDYIIASETAIQAMVKSTTESSSADSIAEIKRLQDELLQEVPVLREKIATELQPPEQQAPAQQQSQVQSATDEDKDQIQKVIQLLQSWADESGTHMEQASASLQGSNAKAAIPKQDAALEALDRIWNAIVDFRSLLSKELEAQTKLVNDLESMASSPTQAETSPEQGEAPEQVIEIDLSQEAREQQKILMKAMLLAPKAEAELQQMENQSALEAPPETAVPETAMPETSAPGTAVPESDANDTEANDAPAKIDPEEIKKGLRLAMELAPKAVEQMESSVQELKKKNRNEAKGFAEEARRILKEIADAQPKDPNQKNDQDQNQQDQNQQDQQDKKNDQEKQDENKNDQRDSKDQDKKSEQDKNDKDKNDKDKQDKEKEKNQQNKDQNDKSGKQPKPNEVSKDRLEEALRKVKEREQEKRERDRELKARILRRSPVEKDW